MSTPAAQPRSRIATVAEDAASRWPLGRIIAAGMLALGVVLIAAIVVGSLALNALSSDRSRVVNTLDPAAFHGSQLYAALLNQETGVRGYLLSKQQPFLVPYHMGLATQQQQVKDLDPLLAGLPVARAELATTLRNIADWRSAYAAPAISAVARWQATASDRHGQEGLRPDPNADGRVPDLSVGAAQACRS